MKILAKCFLVCLSCLVFVLCIVQPTILSMVTLVLSIVCSLIIVKIKSDGEEVSAACKISVVFGIFSLISTLCSLLSVAYACDAAMFVGSVGLIVMLVYTLAFGFIRWKKVSCLWLVPFAICFLAFCGTYLMPSVANLTNDFLFNASFLSYSSVVERIAKGDIPVSSDLRTITVASSTLPMGVIDVVAAKKENKHIIVQFMRSSNGHMHKGYLFTNSNLFDSGGRPVLPELPRYVLRRLKKDGGNWYYFQGE